MKKIGLKEIMKMMDGLSGQRGLLVAITTQAWRDYLFGSPQDHWDALDYFSDDQYLDHLLWLDLPPGHLPQGIDRDEVLDWRFAKITQRCMDALLQPE